MELSPFTYIRRANARLSDYELKRSDYIGRRQVRQVLDTDSVLMVINDYFN
jgi:hypothetical protein